MRTLARLLADWQRCPPAPACLAALTHPPLFHPPCGPLDRSFEEFMVVYAGIMYESAKQGFSFADWKKSKE